MMNSAKEINGYLESTTALDRGFYLLQVVGNRAGRAHRSTIADVLWLRSCHRFKLESMTTGRHTRSTRPESAAPFCVPRLIPIEIRGQIVGSLFRSPLLRMEFAGVNSRIVRWGWVVEMGGRAAWCAHPLENARPVSQKESQWAVSGSEGA